MTARATVFGKLPCHGDFVARGLDTPARDAWDSLLSGQIERTRERLGDRFETAHDIAPPWRFVLGPGRFGSGWRAGSLAPSMDSAGRRFFIVVAADDLPLEHASHGPALADKMETLIYEALNEAWDADTLIDAASRSLHTFALEDLGPSRDGWWITDAEGLTAYRTESEPDDLISVDALLASGSVAA